MSRRIALRVVVCVIGLVLVAGAEVQAGGRDFTSIAGKIINNLASIQPGEVVVIRGNSDQQPLLEALVEATWIAGGQPTVEVVYPEADKRAFMAMSIEYMKFPRWYGLAQTRLVDCFIDVSSIPDPTLYADVPEERFEVIRNANVVLQRAYQQSRYRSVSIGQTGGVPTPEYAASRNIPYETMKTMFWHAVDTDYVALKKKARSVAAAMTSGAKVRVTSGAGTDITFVVNDTPARINCGRPDDNLVASGPMLSWLPAGEAFAAVRPGSANGTVVVPSLDFRGEVVKNLRMTFADGSITSLSADENSKIVTTFLDATTGESKMLSIFDVGVNPDSKMVPGSDYASWEMAGMVSLAIGNNSWAGGTIESSEGLGFHLPGATLTVGNTVVSEKGSLK
jgi:aminopeptidase